MPKFHDRRDSRACSVALKRSRPLAPLELLASVQNTFEAVRKRLNPPFLGDLTIGLVDGSNLLSGDRDKLLGHAAGDQFIGMVF